MESDSTIEKKTEVAFDQMMKKIEGQMNALKSDVILNFTKVASKDPNAFLNANLLDTFDKEVSDGLIKLELKGVSPKILKPSLKKKIEANSKIGYNYGANAYDMLRHQYIICPSDSTMHIYKSEDTTPNKYTITSSVVVNSYSKELDLYFLGCAGGETYLYSPSKQLAKQQSKPLKSPILAIAHLTGDYFVYSATGASGITLCHLQKENLVSNFKLEGECWSIDFVESQSIVLCGLSTGHVSMFLFDGETLVLLKNVQAHKSGKFCTAIMHHMIKSTEFVATGGNDKNLNIWKAQDLDLVEYKSMKTSGDISMIVYLDRYQAIATSHHKEYIIFWSFPEGECLTKIETTLTQIRNIFYAEDKDQLGVSDLKSSTVFLISLS